MGSKAKNSLVGGSAQVLLSRFSIPARLVFLATALIAVFFVSNFILGRELSANARAQAEDAELVDALRAATQAHQAFGDLKYWMTDLAVSLLMNSERELNAAQAFAAVVGSYGEDPLATFHLKRLLAGEKGVDIVLSGG